METDDPPVTTLGDVIGELPLTAALAILGLIGAIVGSFGPWGVILIASVSGLRGDGRITLGLSILAIVLLVALPRLTGRSRSVTLVITFLAIASTAAVAGYDAIHIDHVAERAILFGNKIASAGWGVYATEVAAAFAFGALAWGMRHRFRVGLLSVALAAGVGVPVAGGIIENQKQANGGSRFPAAANSGKTGIDSLRNSETTGAGSPGDHNTGIAGDSGSSGTTTSASLGDGTRSCDGTVYAAPGTNCSLAQNVFAAYLSAVNQGSSSNITVTADTPYSASQSKMACAPTGATISCTSGGSLVRFAQPTPATVGPGGILQAGQHCAGDAVAGALGQSTICALKSSAVQPAVNVPTTADLTSGTRSCGQSEGPGTVYAGPSTRCDFAQNVYGLYDTYLYASPSAPPGTLDVYNPASNQSDPMTCSGAAGTITCTGASGALVRFSQPTVGEIKTECNTSFAASGTCATAQSPACQMGECFYPDPTNGPCAPGYRSEVAEPGNSDCTKPTSS
jgi:hypothetical protein